MGRQQNALEVQRDLIEKFAPGATDWAQETLRPVFPDLVDKLATDIYGFAYRRGHLPLKVRHLISLATLSAIGACENQLRFQLRAALNIGLKPEEIREIFIQISVFAGHARAINAALLLAEVQMADEK